MTLRIPVLLVLLALSGPTLASATAETPVSSSKLTAHDLYWKEPLTKQPVKKHKQKKHTTATSKHHKPVPITHK